MVFGCQAVHRRRPLTSRLTCFRPRAHLPHVQTHPRLDQPEAARPVCRRPLDLAGAGRLHQLRLPHRRRRPPPALGTPHTTRTAHPCPRPPRASAPTHQSRLPRRRTKPSRPGPGRPADTPTATEPPATTSTSSPPRPAANRKHHHENENLDQPEATTHRLKIKLEVLNQTSGGEGVRRLWVVECADLGQILDCGAGGLGGFPRYPSRWP